MDSAGVSAACLKIAFKSSVLWRACGVRRLHVQLRTAAPFGCTFAFWRRTNEEGVPAGATREDHSAARGLASLSRVTCALP